MAYVHSVQSDLLLRVLQYQMYCVQLQDDRLPSIRRQLQRLISQTLVSAVLQFPQHAKVTHFLLSDGAPRFMCALFRTVLYSSIIATLP